MSDSLRVIRLRDVIERTGYSRMTILRGLAADTMDKTPGRTFPAPLKPRPGSNRLEWREAAWVQWLEQRSMDRGGKKA